MRDHGRLTRFASEDVVQVHRVEIERGIRVALQEDSADRIRDMDEHPLAGRRIRAGGQLTLAGLKPLDSLDQAQGL